MANDANPHSPETAIPAPAKRKPPQRLGTAAFQTAFKNGRPQRHPLLHVRIWRRADGDSTTRVAFVVAKKLGKATFRNRLRRRLREIYRLLPSDPTRLAGCDVIFLATPTSAAATAAELRASIQQLIERSTRPASRPRTGPPPASAGQSTKPATSSE